MPKLKTKKAAAKRFRFSATGKVKFKRAGLRHILTNKSGAYNQEQRTGGYLTQEDAPRVPRMLPYGN